MLFELANTVADLHESRSGRKPTEARAHMHRDVLVVVLRGGSPHAEQGGLEHSVEREWAAAVEGLVGRKVTCVMSASNRRVDVQTDVFVFDDGDRSDSRDLADRARRAVRASRQVREQLRASRSQAAGDSGRRAH